MRLPIQIQVYGYRQTEDKIEYLLLKRIPEKGGNWQACTGGLEDGETLQACALRELAEETTITEVQSLYGPYHIFQFTEKGFYEAILKEENVNISEVEDGVTITEFVWGAKITSDEKIDLTKNIYPEHDEYKWCSYEEAMDLLYWENGKVALKILHETLSKNL